MYRLLSMPRVDMRLRFRIRLDQATFCINAMNPGRDVMDWVGIGYAGGETDV